MSDTPETDRIVRNAAMADHPPTRLAATLTVKCEKLERERDEAREELRLRPDALSHDAWDNICRRLERERDELKKELLKCNEYNDELYRKLTQ